jgi:HEPN domain-containing protein
MQAGFLIHMLKDFGGGCIMRQGNLMNRWKDWYEQGKRDMSRAHIDLEYRYYEWACFTSQQACEKVIKAVALKMGINLWGHSLTEMLKIISSSLDIPSDIIEKAKLLDLYYIPPRYPNGFPSGKPADYFTEKQAKEAIDASGDIIRFCEGRLFK